MKGLRGLVIIWVAVLITLVGGYYYVNSTINRIVRENHSQGLKMADTLYLQEDCLFGGLECEGLSYFYPLYGDVRLQYGESPINKVFN